MISLCIFSLFVCLYCVVFYGFYTQCKTRTLRLFWRYVVVPRPACVLIWCCDCCNLLHVASRGSVVVACTLLILPTVPRRPFQSAPKSDPACRMSTGVVTGHVSSWNTCVTTDPTAQIWVMRPIVVSERWALRLVVTRSTAAWSAIKVWGVSLKVQCVKLQRKPTM